MMLWFDVEKRYLTTLNGGDIYRILLWFDVEKRYLTTITSETGYIERLWFDVEKRYLTTSLQLYMPSKGCGLM